MAAGTSAPTAMHLDPSYDSAWEDIQVAFGLDGRQMSLSDRVPAETTVFLEREELLVGVLEYLESELAFRLRNDVAPAFWSFFHRGGGGSRSRGGGGGENDAAASTFSSAVSDLHFRVSHLLPFARRMDGLGGDGHPPFGQPTYADLLKLLLKSTLHSQLPADFGRPVEAFYTRAFHVFHVRREKELNRSQMDDSNCSKGGGGGGQGNGVQGDDGGGQETCDGCCQAPVDGCRCGSVVADFHDANGKLRDLDLLERLTSDVVTKIVRGKIESHVNESCQGSFTASYLSALEDWLDAVVVKWLRTLYDGGGEDDALLAPFRRRLLHFLYETYTRARIDQLFNVIIEFPESQPALEDVKECLAKTDLRGHLTRSLKSVLRTKLLHLGVNTADILTAYIAAIRALRVLDPSGVLLELVCEPVRRYLRTREDTVRCIVSSLIDDSSSELAEELTKGEGLCLLDESAFAGGGGGEQDEMESTWEHWQPDPVDAEQSKGGEARRRRSSDIISMLVNIYGSKELFVNEYRSLLSNRLLSQFSYDTEREIRNLELLKLRFGEAPLHQCEVMLKDVSDSKRINALLQVEEAFPVSALVLSAQFWPQFKSETLTLPPVVDGSLEAYTKAFEATKGNRTLAWKRHLGFANIDLSIGERKINLTVSPDHAAIIWRFTERDRWSVEELAASLAMPATRLRRRIGFWVAQGLLEEGDGAEYVLAEDGSMMRRGAAAGAGGGGGAGGGCCGVGGETVEGGDLDDDEAESVTRTSKDQRAEELQVFWSYIVNMLINLESLPLERIFQMLKMFAMQGPSAAECDIEELRAFLDEKVWQHELTFSGGQYKLPKT